MARGHLLMARKHAATDHAMRSIASAQKDELALASLSKRVAGPLGNRLTLADLPSPDTKRWVVRRKAEVVAAVRGGLLSQEEACRRYALNSDEFLCWQHCVDRFGLPGLRTTRNSVLSERGRKIGSFGDLSGGGCVDSQTTNSRTRASEGQHRGTRYRSQPDISRVTNGIAGCCARERPNRRTTEKVMDVAPSDGGTPGVTRVLRGGMIARPMAGRAKGQGNFNATMRRPGSCGLIVPPALLALADEVIE